MAPAPGKEDVKAAYGVLQLLKDNLPKNCKLSIEREEEIVIKALTRHGNHLSAISVAPTHLDPFKLLCWNQQVREYQLTL
jgi:hypothetical protein